MLRYFNFEPSFKLRWCCARDLFGSQIPVTTGGFAIFGAIFLVHAYSGGKLVLYSCNSLVAILATCLDF